MTRTEAIAIRYMGINLQLTIDEADERWKAIDDNQREFYLTRARSIERVVDAYPQKEPTP